jgi:hypothetical protein
MKNLLILVVGCLSIGGPALAQSPAAFVCNYTGAPGSPGLCEPTAGVSNAHAEQVLERILKPIGLTRNFGVMECANTQNCFATVIRGQRLIIYDGAFMSRIGRMTNTDWSAVSIMAHEIGHHLQGHTIDGTGARPQKELEADTFSGFVLHQLGASLNESLTAILLLGSDRPSATHPARFDRVEAIKKGWLEADELYPGPASLRANPAQTAAARQPAPTRPDNAMADRTQPETALTLPRPASSRPTTQPATAGSNRISAATTGCLSGNCRNGIGVFVSPARERYEGEFADGDRHGQGTQYRANGQVEYRGSFRDDQRNGIGAYYFANGDRYVGPFVANLPNGKGTYYFADGDRFVGQFRDGQRNGPGTLTHPDGTSETAVYKDDEAIE